MKIKKTKLNFGILLAGIIELILVVGLTPANSYMISQSIQDYNNNIIIKEKSSLKNILLKTSKFMSWLFTIKQIGVVSAQELPTFSCCVSGNEGSCQDFVPGANEPIESGCDQVLNTACENTDSCRVGCCVDTNEGTCDPMSSYTTCVDPGENAEWKEDSQCNIPECGLGCCLYENTAEFTTETGCNKISEQQGVEITWDSSMDQLSCLAVPITGEDGACVSQGGNCERTKEDSCESSGGQFFEGYLCSNTELIEFGVECERQASTGCAENRDEIFWFDSCGNRENIYSSSKDSSWNSGKILEKTESCGADNSDGNKNSQDCGNCNQFLGSICSETKAGETKIKDGDLICGDLNCYDAPVLLDKTGETLESEDKLHGDTWCMYYGKIGNSTDVVGSEHYAASCLNGEVRMDKCGDMRSEVCGVTEIKQEATGKTRSIGRCVPNQAQLCYGYNTDRATVKENCEANAHCEMKYIRVGQSGGFNFDFCLPKYPIGFDLNPYDDLAEAGIELSSDIPPEADYNSRVCSTAEIPCTVVRERQQTNLFETNWVDVFNQDCRNLEYGDKMSDFCTSLGDCGDYVNYLGEPGQLGNMGAGGYIKPGSNLADWVTYENYRENANPVAGQKVSPQTAEYLASLLGTPGEVRPSVGEGEPEDTRDIRIFGTILPLILTITAGASAIATFIPLSLIQGIEVVSGGFPLFPPWTSAYLASGGTSPAGSPGFSLASTNPGFWITVAPYASAVIGAAIGAYAGSQLAKQSGIHGAAADAMVISGAVAGAGLGVLVLATTSDVVYASLSTGQLWAAGIAAGLGTAVIIYIETAGLGEHENKDATFKCDPWEAPLGGEDCEKCNADPWRPCTKYRCESLGLQCKMLNEGEEENPHCVAIDIADTNAPNIIDAKALTEGYEMATPENYKTDLTTTSGECIPEFEPVEFEIATDQYSKCSWSWTRPTGPVSGDNANISVGEIGDIGLGPGETDFIFRRNHTFTVSMPGVSAIESYYTEGDVERGYTGELKMYLTCENFNGLYNFDPFVVDVCISSEPNPTPAYITQFSPTEGSYLKYNTTENLFSLWVNKPADCKWSKEKDVAYEDMAEEMTCVTRPFDKEGNIGWKCDEEMTDLTPGENKIYIKCKNLPWLEEDDETRRVNTEDFEYSLIVTETPLEITATLPEGIITGADRTVTKDLEVWTTGGAYGGVADCSFFNNDFWSRFPGTPDTYHKQPYWNLYDLVDGVNEFNLPIKCVDAAENDASGAIVFNLSVDVNSPSLTGVSLEGSSLKINTDEEAQCYYRFDNCRFDIGNGTSMTTAFSKMHSASWNPTKVYYIKCKDIYENKNSGCLIEVSAGYFED